jgi:putative transposase
MRMRLTFKYRAYSTGVQVDEACRLYNRALQERRDAWKAGSPFGQLLRAGQPIAVEDLYVEGLAASMLAGSIHDAGWAAFLAKLDYKAEGAGRRVVRVNPAGTTQRCSACGEDVPKTLSQRWHDCPVCGLSPSRDENAARDILRLGLSLAEQTWPVAASISAEARLLELTE